MLHTFQVPVKPHVQKYLAFHLGRGYKLTSTDAFGRCLKMLLQLPRTNAFLNGFTARYTAVFGVGVEGNMILQKRLRSLSAKSVIDFNNFVEAIIKTEFHAFVDNRRLFDLSQYGSIQAFRHKYDFQDEDISFDTLKKSWQRFMDDRAAASTAPNPVSVCPPRRPQAAA